MPLVDVSINGRNYGLTCEKGEEEHLRELAAHVDQKVIALAESLGQIGDTRLLLMAAILTADEHIGLTQRLDAQAKAMVDLSQANEELKERLARAEDVAAQVLDTATKRIDDIAARLEAA
ncbi:MAG: cell division protein ZapA [Alphaproteobacteria bacterium]|nr:cell division protein ZapA [Alphaproteobacteria bacterium]MBV9064001.1 cell division protein ZapA [Alphaproteobacteria bacterium]